MPAALIILAHPEARSFNATWARASASALATHGHEVIWSDLCAMGFDPVERAGHYGTRPEGRFDPLKAQETASADGTLPADVASEMGKIRRADTLVLHFPVWWFAPPAILKGWCERVLAHGALHTTGARFDTGLCAGKRVLFCVTTGSSADESAPDGREGDIRLLLWPLAYTFRYLGMTVLEPVIVHGVHGYHRDSRKQDLERRLVQVLAGHDTTIAGLAARADWPFNADRDFDAQGRLRPEAPSHAPMIRHRS